MKPGSRNSRFLFSTFIIIVLSTMFFVPTTQVEAGNAFANSSTIFYLPWAAGKAVLVSRAGANHGNAIDFVMKGTPILAASSGYIRQIVETNTKSGCNASYAKYNNQVMIETDKKEKVYYLHLETNSVPNDLWVGKYITRGTLIGKSGNIGYVCGQNGGWHLHFEVRSSSGAILAPRFADVNGYFVASNTSPKSGNIRPTTPAAPQLLPPLIQGTFLNRQVGFVWKAIPAPVDFPISSYELQISSTSNFKAPWFGSWVFRSQTTSSTSFKTTLGAGTYYWRVRGKNSLGTGAWSATGSFTVPRW